MRFQSFLKPRGRKAGFTLVEVLIALLLVSTLGMGISLYLQRNTQTLRSSDQGSDIERNSTITTRLLTQDIRQATYLNPSCAGNPGNADATVACNLIPVRGGILPLPGLNQAAVDLLGNVSNPATLTMDPSLLPSVNDGLRLIQFDFDQNFECILDRSVDDNPIAGSESFIVPDSCQAQLQVGGIYVLVEQMGAQSFSNVFQITGLSLAGSQLTVQHASGSGNIFNQVGSLRNSGFSNDARIYPIQMVEYAIDEALGTGLYRREIQPSAADLNGFQVWVPVDSLVETMQLQSVSVQVNGTAVFHNRSLSFTADQGNNGLEDIRGVRPRMIFRSQRQAEGDQVFSNPMIPMALEDNFPRKDVLFFVSLQNFEFQ